jgi:hypothetical protein
MMQWRMMRKLASRGSILLWLGAFSPGPMPEAWRELQRRYQTVGVRADDAWDNDLPEGVQFAAYDPLAARLTTIDTAAVATKAAHRRWRGQREAHFAHLFPRLDDRIKALNTADPIEAIVSYFHRHRHGGAAA